MKFRELLGPRRGLTRVRSDLLNDGEWHEQMVYHEIHRPAGMDEVAYSAIRRGSNRVSVVAFGGDGAKPGGRQRRALAMLHHEVSRRMGQRLASWGDTGRHHLTPKQQEVFDLLLTGADERSIVNALKRSRSTVTEHIRNIYQHFNVSSRSELLAALLRRQVAIAPVVQTAPEANGEMT